MADIIKMNYPLMEAMATAFGEASNSMDEIIQEVNNIAQTLANGALLGQGGTLFEEACRQSLIPASQRLQEKFTELQQDILAAVEAMRGIDTEVQGFVG